ncbi:MAG: AEC family transporter [Planctomycetaceae bacterium]|jgi:predicted permease|nr:AEC family transporter [Planctomycetaceae bacterium]
MPDTNVIGFTVFHTILAVNAIMAAGVLLRKLKVLRQEADQSLFDITLTLLMPCLILDNLLFAEAFSDLHFIVVPPLIGFVGTVIGTAIAAAAAFLLPRFITGITNAKQRGTFSACTGMLNYGFVPIPLVVMLFPRNGQIISTLFLQNLGAEFSIWTITLLAISGKFHRDSWKRAVNPPTITITVAITAQLLQRLLPAGTGETFTAAFPFFRQTLHLLGAAAIPMTVLMVGSTIADQIDWKRMKTELPRGLRVAVLSSVIRLGVLPVIYLLAAILLPVPQPVKYIIVIHGAMSSAIFPIVLSRFYGGDSSTAVFAVIGNTLVGIIATPMWIGLGVKLVGS